MFQTAIISERSPAAPLTPTEEESWNQIVAKLQMGETPLSWVDADSIPELRRERYIGETAAQSILDNRMQLLRDGEFDSVPDVVDPLTTAGRALEARNLYGEGSEEYKKARFSLKTDCQRLLAEAMRKRTWEYFPEIEQEYDEQTDGYQFMDRQLLDMVRDGVTPVAEKEEQAYRTGEYVEEVTYGAIRRLGGLAIRNHVLLQSGFATAPTETPDLRVNTISECADWAIDAYTRKSKGGFGGYAPEINKLMIRGIRYDSATGNRYQGQMALPGTYITHEVINEVMRLWGMAELGQQLTKEEVRAKQMLNLNGQDVLYVAKILDEIASRRSGKNIFRGEVVPDGHSKNYDSIPAEAVARQELLVEDSDKLADYLMRLEEFGTDHGVVMGLVENHVKKVAFDKVKNTPAQVAEVFDDQTAQTLEQAAREREAGNAQKADLLEKKAWKEAPPVSFCGAGSCGLVEVNPSSAEGRAIIEKLKAKPGDQVLRDTERSCIECGTTGSVYYNTRTTSKACGKCGASEIKEA